MVLAGRKPQTHARLAGALSRYTGIAQLEERKPDKLDVSGSTPDTNALWKHNGSLGGHKILALVSPSSKNKVQRTG